MVLALWAGAFPLGRTVLRVSHSDVFDNFRTGNDMLDAKTQSEGPAYMYALGVGTANGVITVEAMDPRSRIGQRIAEFDSLPPARAASHGYVGSVPVLRRLPAATALSHADGEVREDHSCKLPSRR